MCDYFSRVKELIMKAITSNDFLRNLETVQINEIIDCMYERKFTREQYICREGGVGTQLYVIAGAWVHIKGRGPGLYWGWVNIGVAGLYWGVLGVGI